VATEGADSYAPLPARKLLTDAYQDMIAELRLRWSLTDVQVGFPALAGVWLSAEATALTRLVTDPEDTPAKRLLEDWNGLDGMYGEPFRRRWALTWSEGAQRVRVLVRYLTESGLLDLATAEADAPEHYFTREELGY
jgi:hypothetical protein